MESHYEKQKVGVAKQNEKKKRENKRAQMGERDRRDKEKKKEGDEVLKRKKEEL